jgi:hypothetical protein
MSDSRHFWYCNVCGFQNSRIDGECQFCECEGITCRKDSCSDPNHFNPVQELLGLVRALMDCHEDRCDGRPGAPCPHVPRAREILIKLTPNAVTEEG